MKRLIPFLLILSLLLTGCTGMLPAFPTETPAARTEEPTETPVPLDPELPVGELTERADAAYYVNQTLGFGCTLNHDWFMISRDDPQTGAAGRVSFMDLSAQRRDASAGLNILVEDASRPGLEPESPEEYRDLSLPGVRQELEQYGCTNIQVEANTFVFVGREYPGIRFSCATPHQDWYCQQIIIGSGQYIVTVSLSTYDEDWLEELAALFYPLDGNGRPAGTEQASGFPEPGVVADGEYRQPFFGLAFPLEGWEQLTDRDEIGRSLFGIPNYASYTVEKLLENHIPYVDLMMARGDTEMEILLEMPPITTSDGSVSNTPAEYMDADARNLPRDYESIGVTVVSDERFQRELCGMTYEGYRLTASYDGRTMYMVTLITEKDGVFFGILINCIGADETEEILRCFRPLE